MKRKASRRSASPLLIAGAAALGIWAGDARAFHSGSAGECDGCHTMHGASSGARYLLQSPNPSSACLNCHADATQRSYSVLTTSIAPGLAPANFTPGGDFGWLGKSYSWSEAGTFRTSPGERHGHSVVAPEFGLTADGERPTAPGGSYPSSALSCVSCHDPHGTYRVTDAIGTVATSGNPIVGSGSYGEAAEFLQPTADTAVGTYRLLAGAGYVPRSASVLPFTAKPPVALSPSVYNKSERLVDVRVAYGKGMSEWCANCHGELHTPAAPSTFLHVSGVGAKLSASRIADIYNTYVRTGDLGGTQVTSYTSLVPYEEGTSDRSALALHARSDGTARSGPFTGSENVSCLSCHRAHASAWDHALRWNQGSPYLVADGQWPGIDATGAAASPELAQGRTMAETRAAMYDRDPSAYATFQTSLCNKCHGK